VDPHLLRTFVTVVRLGSFSATAAELGYTQAAVSQQIAALEGGLKVTLLNRRPVTRRAPACSSTPTRSCSAWTPPVPTSQE
jgi:DNA-binding transcriptional LysR family regulator